MCLALRKMARRGRARGPATGGRAPGGEGDGAAADAGHRLSRIYARISPTSWALRACTPDMIPRLVLTMTSPRPPRTRGISVLPAYTRSPGLLIRFRPGGTGAPPRRALGGV